MKNKLKYIIFTFIILPVVAFFSFSLTGCTFNTSNTAVSIVSVVKTNSEGLNDTYTITYSDGSTSNFTITNGQDGTNGTNGENGESLSFSDLFDTAVDEGYTGTFLEFLQEYLTITIDTSKSTLATNQALRSAVSIYSNFTTVDLNESTSAGSGVIYTLDKVTGSAYIITNYHVVYSVDSNTTNNISDDISIYIYGSENEDSKITATYVGGSMNYDIAVLKVENSEILKNSDTQAILLADSNLVQVGQTAIAVGNPEAEGISATNGIVSIDSEYITMTATDEITSVTFRVMRIDTPINSGNSGGGLYNDDGELIGIVNAKVKADGVENIGYAIPSSIAIKVADNIIANNTVKKLILGVTVQATNSKAVYNEDTLATTIEEDIVVYQIAENSISQSLGLQIGDIITSIQINNTLYSLTRMYQLPDLLILVKNGDSISINITRNETPQSFSYTPDALDFITIV